VATLTAQTKPSGITHFKRVATHYGVSNKFCHTGLSAIVPQFGQNQPVVDGNPEAESNSLLAKVKGFFQNHSIGTLLLIGLPLLATVLATFAFRAILKKTSDSNAASPAGDAQLEQEVGALLKQKKVTVATAESCTGGLVSSRLTNVSGSSDYTKLNLVTYSSEDKIRILGVQKEAIEKHTAASEEVARQMAIGAKRVAKTQFALSTTGFVGPDESAKEENPYGFAYIGIAYEPKYEPGQVVSDVIQVKLDAPCNREEAKRLFSQAALALLKSKLEQYPDPPSP
jgi:PncC family amidohydrolase